jgi:hypothetical protein
MNKFNPLVALALSTGLAAYALTPPPTVWAVAAGEVIINEYTSDNDANGNDFVELLVLSGPADLRGLRISDNELITGTLNTNEAVYIFGQDSFLSAVPGGTTIAVYTLAAGVVPDTVADPAASDWSMTLAPGSGIDESIDGQLQRRLRHRW